MIQHVKLSCPACKKITQVYHLDWDAIKCKHCKNFIDKHEWQLAYTPPKIKISQAGQTISEKETEKIYKTLEEWNSK